jgi:uncharacterized lipoprotein YmbA
VIRLLRILATAAALSVAACSSTPVPEVRYYRMPDPAPPAAQAAPVFDVPLVVDALLADGLHAQQAMLYQTTPGGPVRTYHYQLWNDPPGRLLQRRLVRQLRAARIAPVIADRLPSRIDQVRITGLVERFERVRTDAGWAAAVRLELRADTGDTQLPAVLGTYEAVVVADGETMQATVRAFATATDQVLARFIDELTAARG